MNNKLTMMSQDLMNISAIEEALPERAAERETAVVERCFLMNLQERSDRLHDWLDALPEPWPLPKPERFIAVDGRRVSAPNHWMAGLGAWGCYRSHVSILEKCLMERINSYVVFEDDAGFVTNFAERLQAYVSELPDDWGLAYLGGQHLHVVDHAPIRLSQHVYRPYNVNRTHAFMVRGRNTMQRLYQHLHSLNWQRGNHIDHHLGKIIERRYNAEKRNEPDPDTVPVYAPDRWMVGQLPTRSSISGRRWREIRYFNHAAEVNRPQEPYFAVLGLHHSGASCVAMIMHHLGVDMGNKLEGYEIDGGGEALGLKQICERVMPFPNCDPTAADDEIIKALKVYIFEKTDDQVGDEPIAGGKYPHLCRLAEHLFQALGDALRIIAIEQPIEASIASLQAHHHQLGGEWAVADDQACETLQRSLLAAREEFLQRHPEVPLLRIDFSELTKNPREQILRLIAFLNIDCSEEEIQCAIDHVNPSLRQHG